MEEELLTCLARLSDAGEAVEEPCSITTQDLATIRTCVAHLQDCGDEDVAELWQKVLQSGQVSMLQLTKALGRTLRSSDQAWGACAFYATLLRLRGCPVGGVLITVLA